MSELLWQNTHGPSWHSGLLKTFALNSTASHHIPPTASTYTQTRAFLHVARFQLNHLPLSWRSLVVTPTTVSLDVTPAQDSTPEVRVVMNNSHFQQNRKISVWGLRSWIISYGHTDHMHTQMYLKQKALNLARFTQTYSLRSGSCWIVEGWRDWWINKLPD